MCTKKPCKGDAVTFHFGTDTKGRECAVNVSIISGNPLIQCRRHEVWHCLMSLVVGYTRNSKEGSDDILILISKYLYHKEYELPRSYARELTAGPAPLLHSVLPIYLGYCIKVSGWRRPKTCAMFLLSALEDGHWSIARALVQNKVCCTSGISCHYSFLGVLRSC